MKNSSRWFLRSGLVTGGAAAVLALASLPAQAVIEYPLSTTGAAGIARYYENGQYFLLAKDTLSDGHCAQWQKRNPGASWAWTGDMVCDGSYHNVGIALVGQQVRICRTGLGNCSTYKQL